VDFIVATQTKVQYATLIYFPSTKLMVMRSNFITFMTVQSSNDPTKHIYELTEAIVSSSSYPTNHKSICYVCIIWILLMGMIVIDDTQLQLPKAQIIPTVVSHWNCSKGQIDEMTRHVNEMSFVFL
jgi:hypothetical protein